MYASSISTFPKRCKYPVFQDDYALAYANDALMVLSWHRARSPSRHFNFSFFRQGDDQSLRDKQRPDSFFNVTFLSRSHSIGS